MISNEPHTSNTEAENVIGEVGANGEIRSVEATTYLNVDELLQSIQGQNKEIEDLKARVERLERQVSTERSFGKSVQQDRSESKFEDHVVLRHEFEIDFDFTLISVLSLNRRRSMYDRSKPRRKDLPSTLVLVGDTQGRLHVRFPNGTKLDSEPMSTGHESPLVHLRYDFSDRSEPTIVTVAEDGSVHVNRITLFAHGRLLLGRWRRPPKNSVEDEDETPYERPQGVSMTMELESVLVDRSDRTGESTQLTAISNVFVREKHLVLLGDSGGRVRVFDVNGTSCSITQSHLTV